MGRSGDQKRNANVLDVSKVNFIDKTKQIPFLPLEREKV
jgi:hypothetical protein